MGLDAVLGGNSGTALGGARRCAARLVRSPPLGSSDCHLARLSSSRISRMTLEYLGSRDSGPLTQTVGIPSVGERGRGIPRGLGLGRWARCLGIGKPTQDSLHRVDREGEDGRTTSTCGCLQRGHFNSTRTWPASSSLTRSASRRLHPAQRIWVWTTVATAPRLLLPRGERPAGKRKSGRGCRSRRDHAPDLLRRVRFVLQPVPARSLGC
jgi:hypothetical protein